MKHCTHCGAEVKEGQEVCLSCGNLLVSLNSSKKVEKKSGILWLLSTAFSVFAFIFLGFSFSFFPLLFLSILFSILGIVFGALGFAQKSRLNIIGIIMGVLAFLSTIFLAVIALITYFIIYLSDDFQLSGNWHFNNDSVFELHESNEACYWKFGEDYYAGTCEYGSVEGEEYEGEKYQYVLYMNLETVYSDGVLYSADEFLELEQPYFIFYIGKSEEDDTVEFYNPTANRVYQAYLEAE